MNEIKRNIAFTGTLYSNNTLSKAKAYAVKIGEKDLYNSLRAKCKELPGDIIKITSYHNFKPIESIRSIVCVCEGKKITKRLDVFMHKFKDVGEATYNMMKEITDKKSKLYQQLFL